ncbi:hypothetical protein BD779DRAFT_1472129 [Infundibulicybe gibba]|nr:hypothetical protein BD779DRAFT_1472129 [Infundibulicybe gibba]
MSMVVVSKKGESREVTDTTLREAQRAPTHRTLPATFAHLTQFVSLAGGSAHRQCLGLSNYLSARCLQTSATVVVSPVVESVIPSGVKAVMYQVLEQNIHMQSLVALAHHAAYKWAYHRDHLPLIICTIFCLAQLLFMSWKALRSRLPPLSDMGFGDLAPGAYSESQSFPTSLACPRLDLRGGGRAYVFPMDQVASYVDKNGKELSPSVLLHFEDHVDSVGQLPYTLREDVVFANVPLALLAEYAPVHAVRKIARVHNVPLGNHVLKADLQNYFLQHDCSVAREGRRESEGYCQWGGQECWQQSLGRRINIPAYTVD